MNQMVKVMNRTVWFMVPLFVVSLYSSATESKTYKGDVCSALLTDIHIKASSIKFGKMAIRRYWEDDRKAKTTTERVKIQQIIDERDEEIEADYLMMASIVSIYKDSECELGPLISKLKCLTDLKYCE